MPSNTEQYDFIVVGGGTSGCVLASRLSRSLSAPKVLLLEGGGRNDDPALRSADHRWSIAFTDPLLNWGYMSVPQNQLLGQQIPCVRGRGLGGSTAINFACWLVGHRDDYNHWAQEVDDPYWNWVGEKGVQQRLMKLENLHLDLDTEQAKVLDRQAQEVHSAGGTIEMGFNQSWSELDTQWFKVAREFGAEVNGDINSGDPTGFGLSPTNYHGGLRVTAATAYLSSPSKNLTIMTDSPVAKVIFDNSKGAVGVQTIAGHIYKASKEVILSAGSLDTPKVLLLSGIGPLDDLSELSVPIVHNLSGVGKNLRDHSLTLMTLLLKPNAQVDVPIASEIPLEASNNPIIARDPLRESGLQCPMAWLSSPIIKSSAEFNALNERTKTYLLKVPSFEALALYIPLDAGLPALKADDRVITLCSGVMNPQSVGTVRLSSSDPKVPALIDPNYLHHPYDRRVAIEAFRAIVKLSKAPTFAAVTERQLTGPEGDSDEEVFEYCKKSLSPIWHFGGSCKMGREDDVMAVVDKEFRVKGVHGLRVVDLSVAPLLPNNHTQSTAYLIGETAAEKMIDEYGL